MSDEEDRNWEQKKRQERQEEWQVDFALRCAGITFLFFGIFFDRKEWAWLVAIVAAVVAFLIGMKYAERHPKHIN